MKRTYGTPNNGEINFSEKIRQSTHIIFWVWDMFYSAYSVIKSPKIGAVQLPGYRKPKER